MLLYSAENKPNIVLIMKAPSGQEVSRYILESPSAVAWSQAAVESGGFKESVDVAVKGVTAKYHNP